MALIDDVKGICDRLSLLGWRDLLKVVTGASLDIQQAAPADLNRELTKDLPSIDHPVFGFEDFASTGQRATTVGQPSFGLLYHALASPLVTRDHQGNPLGGFATPTELDNRRRVFLAERSLY